MLHRPLPVRIRYEIQTVREVHHIQPFRVPLHYLHYLPTWAHRYYIQYLELFDLRTVLGSRPFDHRSSSCSPGSRLRLRLRLRLQSWVCFFHFKTAAPPLAIAVAAIAACCCCSLLLLAIAAAAASQSASLPVRPKDFHFHWSSSWAEVFRLIQFPPPPSTTKPTQTALHAACLLSTTGLSLFAAHRVVVSFCLSSRASQGHAVASPLLKSPPRQNQPDTDSSSEEACTLLSFFIRPRLFSPV